MTNSWSQMVTKNYTVFLGGFGGGCLLLILRFGDEVDFSAGFPARPVGSLGGPIPSAWLLVLLGLPTPSSTSPLSLGRTWASFRLAFRLSAGWWAYSAHPTQSPKCRFFQGFWWPTPAQWKVKGFSWRYYTLILAKRPRSCIINYTVIY